MFVIMEGEIGLVKSNKYNHEDLLLNVTQKERWNEYGVIKHVMGTGQAFGENVIIDETSVNDYYIRILSLGLTQPYLYKLLH